MEKSNSGISVSNLYSLVKQYDKDFTPAPEVNPALLNDDGTPKVVYHGTDEDFTVFDITKSRSYYEAPDYDLPGFYFSESVEESSSYGNIGQYYIRISNPYDGDVYRLAKQKGSYRKAYDYLVEEGYDGIIVDDMGEGYTEYIVFKPTQIKSADNNIGTFDSFDPDTRHSYEDDIDKTIDKWSREAETKAGRSTAMGTRRIQKRKQGKSVCLLTLR